MKKVFAFVIASCFVSTSLFSGEKPAKPRLIVGIVVEQMRYEYIYRYWDKFGDNGFKKLLLNGASCKNVHADYLLTQTSPGCATISTGTNPCSHGIIADEWYDRVKEKTVKATSDETTRIILGADKDNTGSPARLCATTIGDELRTVSPSSKVISISLNSNAAILLGGHKADAAYWMDEITGDWTTSTYYRQAPPIWLNDFNAKRMNDVYLQKTWYPLLSFDKYTESLPDKNEYEIGINNQTTFPYRISALADKYRRYKILKSTPQGNSYTKDMAIRTVVGENMGKDASTDILWLCFSATENIGLKFGPRSVEVEDAYLQLDREIEFFLQFAEKEVGKDNLLVFLTSNHGTADNPTYLMDNKLPAGQFKQVKAEQLLRSYLNAVYGAKEWISYFGNKTVYFNHNAIEDAHLDLKEVQEKSTDFMVKLAGIANVLSSCTLQGSRFNDGVSKQIYNSYNQKRSGDLLINLEPGWIEQTVTESTAHNSPYNYDTHVCLIWYGWKVEKTSITRFISLADIAPTLSMFLNVPETNVCNGNAIWELNDDSPY